MRYVVDLAVTSERLLTEDALEGLAALVGAVSGNPGTSGPLRVFVTVEDALDAVDACLTGWAQVKFRLRSYGAVPHLHSVEALPAVEWDERERRANRRERR